MNIPRIKGPYFKNDTFEVFQNGFLIKKQEVSPSTSENCINKLDPNSISRQLVISENSIFKCEDGKSQVEMSNASPKNMFPQDLLKFHIEKENSLVLLLIKKFILRLRNTASLRNINMLKNVSFLGDLALFPEKASQDEEKIARNKFFIWLEQELEILKKNNQIRKIGRFFKNHNTLIYPYQTFKILWDFAHLILIVYWFFAIPLFSVFREEIQNKKKADSYFTICFLIMDIVLNLNTTYFKKGLIERSRWKILSNYWKNYLKHDIITLIPIFLECLLIEENSPFSRYADLFKFVFFLKISTCQEICSRILEKFLLKEQLKCIMDLIKTLFISIFVAHLFACFWFFIADRSMEKYQSNWILKADLLEASWDIKYLYSIYWAFVTMMTVGYGDITPQNEVEVIVCIVTVILGCAVYAYNISSIGMILQELNKENAEFNHKINVINRFMNRKNINKDLQRRIREYLRFLWKEENTQNLEEEQKIIELLSGSLKEELYIDAYGSLLEQDPMFYVNFSEKTLKKIVSKIKEIRLFPEEKIFIQNEEDDCSLYFVIKGKMELVSKTGNSDIALEEIGIGRHFGEISFFTAKRREFSAQSKDFTTLFSISRADFVGVLEKNRDDYEKFFMIRDQILLYGNCNPIYSRCFCCKQNGHLSNVCPMIHYIPDREKIIKTLMFSNDQIRCQIVSRKTKKNNAFINKISLSVASVKIQEVLNKERSDDQLRQQKTNSEEEEDDNFDENAEKVETSCNQIGILSARSKENLVKENADNFGPSKEESNLPQIQEISRQEENNGSFASLEYIKPDKINSDSEKVRSTKEVIDSENLKQVPNKPLEKTYTKKFKTMKKIISIANLNSHSSCAAIIEPFLDVFETVKSFKNYFPDQNCETILQNVNKRTQINKNKDNQKKIIENKLRLAKYTFYVEEMRNNLFIKSF